MGDGTISIEMIMQAISILGLIISALTFNSAVKERHAKTAAETAGINAELKSLRSEVNALKNYWSEADDGYHRNAERLTAVEGHIKDLDRRVDALERQTGNA